MKRLFAIMITLLLASPVVAQDCDHSKATSASKGNLVMFIGIDISGSFKKLRGDALKFISHYLYAHLHGCGGFKQLKSLFVGSIGGARPDEPKTFYPIETFKYKSIADIEKQLWKIFLRVNPINTPTTMPISIRWQPLCAIKKLVMKPTEIILLSDGIPDAPKVKGKARLS